MGWSQQQKKKLGTFKLMKHFVFEILLTYGVSRVSKKCQEKQ